MANEYDNKRKRVRLVINIQQWRLNRRRKLRYKGER